MTIADRRTHLLCTISMTNTVRRRDVSVLTYLVAARAVFLLPSQATQQCTVWESNSRSVDHKSDALTTTLPSHHGGLRPKTPPSLSQCAATGHSNVQRVFRQSIYQLVTVSLSEVESLLRCQLSQSIKCSTPGGITQ